VSGLGSISAANAAFGKFAVSAGAASGVGNYTWAAHNKATAKDDEDLNRKMAQQMGINIAVGGTAGVIGGVTTYNALREMVRENKLTYADGSVNDEAIRDISSSNEAQAIRKDAAKAPESAC
jgi:hypothetical protein